MNVGSLKKKIDPTSSLQYRPGDHLCVFQCLEVQLTVSLCVVLEEFFPPPFVCAQLSCGGEKENTERIADPAFDFGDQN